MSASVVSKKKPNPVSEQTIQLRCPADWLERVDEHAARVGLTRSAYIRLRMSEIMNEEDSEKAKRQAEEK